VVRGGSEGGNGTNSNEGVGNAKEISDGQIGDKNNPR